MVVTLYIPSDTQTLAPKDVKRAPRKQPSYCQNYKSPAALAMPFAAAAAATPMPASTTSSSDQHDRLSTPAFFIKGYEITDKSSSASTSDMDRSTTINRRVRAFGDNVDGDDDDENDDNGHDGQNDSCCTCMLDGGHIDDEYTLLAKTELLLNFDGYEMDTFGHLPGDSRTPTPSPIRRFVDGTPRCRMRRTCSPGTGQVIRVTMNNKSGKRR